MTKVGPTIRWDKIFNEIKMIITNFRIYFNKHLSILNIHSNLLIHILILSFLFVSDARAGVWEELPKEAQDKVLEELEAGLPDGSTKEYSKLVRENFREWSTHLGEISAGEYHNAMDVVARSGAGYLSSKISENLPPGAKKWYDLAAEYPDTAIKVGQTMLNPNKSWGDVGDIVWDKAITEIESNLSGKPKAFVIKVINDLFGSRSFAGYTPGDAYFASLDAWAQFVKKKEREWNQSGINAAFKLYIKMRDNGSGFDSIEDALIYTRPPGSIHSYFYSMRNMGFNVHELVSKFKEAELDGTRSDFITWLKLSKGKALNVLDLAKNDEKTKLHQALNKVRNQLVGYPTTHFDAIRNKLNKLIEKYLNKEDKAELEQAKTRAELTLGVYKKANVRLQNACKMYNEAARQANTLYDQAEELKRDAKELDDHVTIVQEIDKLNENTLKTIDQFNEFNQLETDLEKSFSSIKLASQKTCTESDNVGLAVTKKEAIKALEAAVSAARTARSAHSNGFQEIESAKKKIGPLIKAILELRKSQDLVKINKIKDSLKAIQQIHTRTKSHGAMMSDYEVARNAMHEALTDTQTNAVPMERMKKEIEALLSGVKQYPSAAYILDELNKEARNANCINNINTQSVKRKFPDKPKISDFLLQKAQAALESAEHLNNLDMSKDELITIAKKKNKLEQKTNKIDSMKFAADICIANAVLKYREKWTNSNTEEPKEEPVIEPTEFTGQCTCSGGSMEIGPYNQESDCLKDQKIWPGDLVKWSEKNGGTCYRCPEENVQCKKTENKKYFVFKRSGAGYHPKWSGYADKVTGYDYFSAYVLPSKVDDVIKKYSQFKCTSVPKPVVSPVLYPTVWEPGTGKIEVVVQDGFDTSKELDPYRCKVPSWVPRDIPYLICNQWKFDSDPKYWGNIKAICGGASIPVEPTPVDPSPVDPSPVDPSPVDPPSPKPDSINPNNPRIAGLISAWVSSAEPPINAIQGANTRYEPWGRFVGTTQSGVIRTTRKPDDVGGKTSPEYLWDKRNQLDSVDHCTLGEFVIANLSNKNMANCKNRYKPIIPNLIGMTSKQAQKRINALKLKPVINIGPSAPSEELASTVERQDIQQGKTLSRGKSVPIWVYGPYQKTVRIPDLKGKTSSEAKIILASLGLKIKIADGDPAPSRNLSGKVQSQQPTSGLITNKGDLIAIKIYTPYIASNLIPDVTNNTVSVAKYRLKLSGYGVSKISTGDPAPTKKLSGKVQRQIPIAGTPSKKGDKLELVVYKDYKKASDKPLPQQEEPKQIKMLVRQAPIIIKKSYSKHYKPAPGKLKGYKVEEAFISPQKTYWHYVTDHGGAEKTVNLTAHFKFDLPPSEIKPGSEIQLNANGTLKGHSYGMYLGASLSYYADLNYGVNFRDGSITLRNGDLPLQKQNSAAVISNAKHGGEISKKIAAKLNVSPSAGDSFSITVTGTRGVKIKWPYKLEKVLPKKPDSPKPNVKSEIPKVTGSTVSAAKNILKLHGFQVSKLSTGDVAPTKKLSRKIQRQSPKEGTQAKRDTQVELIIYSDYKKTIDEPSQPESVPQKEQPHPCGDDSFPVDATWTFYARIYGGGNSLYFEKAGVICGISGYTSISGGVFADYTCKKWLNCQRTNKPESPITNIENNGDTTVYHYNKGASWGVRKSKTNSTTPQTAPSKKPTGSSNEASADSAPTDTETSQSSYCVAFNNYFPVNIKKFTNRDDDNKLKLILRSQQFTRSNYQAQDKPVLIKFPLGSPTRDHFQKDMEYVLPYTINMPALKIKNKEQQSVFKLPLLLKVIGTSNNCSQMVELLQLNPKDNDSKPLEMKADTTFYNDDDGTIISGGPLKKGWSDNAVKDNLSGLIEVADAFDCFVATAVYQTVSNPELESLRHFRDKVMLDFPAGKSLVNIYYQNGPRLSAWLKPRPQIRVIVKPLITGLSKLVGNITDERHDFYDANLLVILGVTETLFRSMGLEGDGKVPLTLFNPLATESATPFPILKTIQ